MVELSNSVNDLMFSYLDFSKLVMEHNLLSDKIKHSVLKEPERRLLVKYYALEVKSIDKSYYLEDAIPYLIENNLFNFLDKKIDLIKLENLIKNNVLDKDVVNSYIEKEKTVLAIKSKDLTNVLMTFNKTLDKEVSKLELIDMVKKREGLKYKINEARKKYYDLAKQTKDILLLNDRDKLSFKWNLEDKSHLIHLDIKHIETIYSEAFFKYLEALQYDAFSFEIKNDKLKKSKNKKINRAYLNNYLHEEKQDYLYVKVLPGLLKKYKQI